MTRYPDNSPWAAARLLALGISIDGSPVRDEVETLERTGLLRRIGLSREELERAVRSLCVDLRRASSVDAYGKTRFRRSQVQAMLREISDPALQRELARQLLETIGADDRVTRAESMLFWDALDCWGLQMRDVMSLPDPVANRAVPGRRPAGQVDDERRSVS